MSCWGVAIPLVDFFWKACKALAREADARVARAHERRAGET